MPQQSHHKGREREQGKRETGLRVTGAGRERKGREGKESGAGGAGDEQRRWARERKTNAPHTHTPKTTKRARYYDARDWSIQGGVEISPSPRTGSSGGEPDATDWSIRGNGENTIKRRPGLEHPGRKGARH